jgi:hypothetical protein
MRTLGITFIVLGILLPTPHVAVFASEFLAIDTCLDRGGSFDYDRMQCDYEQNHPYVSFSARHPVLAPTFLPLAGLGASFAGVGAFLVFRRSAARI